VGYMQLGRYGITVMSSCRYQQNIRIKEPLGINKACPLLRGVLITEVKLYGMANLGLNFHVPVAEVSVKGISLFIKH
jgi:hypothetical protein